MSEPASPRDEVAALALVVVGWLLLFAPLLGGERLLFHGEIHEVLYPFHRFVRDEIFAGRGFPLWNPYPFFGYPWIAAPQAAPFYPLHWPFWLGLETAHGLSVEIAVHLGLAAASAYAFARVGLGLGASASAVVAAVYGFNGHMVGNVEQLHNHATLAWLPVVLLAITRATDRASSLGGALRWCGVGGVAFGLSALGGMAQQSLYVGVVSLAWLASRTRLASVDRTILVSAGVFVVGTLLYAIQLLPTWELLGLTARRLAEPSDALGGLGASFKGADLLGLLVPTLGPDWADRGWQGLSTVWVGALPVALAAAGLAAGPSPRVQGRIFFAVLAAVSLLFVLGDRSPLASTLYEIPGMSLFRDPARAASMLALAIAVLAGVGLERGARRGAAAAAAALAAVVVALPLVGRQPRAAVGFEAIEATWPQLVVLATVPTLAGAMVLARTGGGGPAGRRVADWGVAALVMLTLVAFGRTSIRTESRQDVQEAVRGPVWLDAVPASARVARVDRADMTIEPFENEFRVRSTTGFSSLVPEHVLAFTRGGAGPIDPMRASASLAFTRRPDRLAAAGVGYLVSTSPASTPPSTWVGVDRGLTLSSFRAGLPRAFVQGDVLAERAPGEVSIVVDEPDHVVVRIPERTRVVDGDRLVLVDTWYPGWEASVDGVPAEIERAAGAFREVSLGSGARRVEFHYRPRAFRRGAVLSALGGLTALVLLCAPAARTSTRGGRSASGRGTPGRGPALP